MPHVDIVVVPTQGGEHGKGRDEIETSMVVRLLTVMCSDLVAALADLCTIDGFTKYFALRRVPSYRHKYAGTIFIVPARRDLRLSRIWIRTGG